MSKIGVALHKVDYMKGHTILDMNKKQNKEQCQIKKVLTIFI